MDIWILYSEILEFGFYCLKFGGIWILHFKVSEFGFYLTKFEGNWILHPRRFRI